MNNKNVDVPADETVAPAKVATASLSDIADNLVQKLPEVQQHAIDREAAKAETAKTVNSDGEVFNSAIHATNDAGEPIKTANGKFAKKRGRKAGGANSGDSGSTVAKPQTSAASGEVAGPSKAYAAGASAAAALIALGMAFGGDEWQPRADKATGTNEFANLSDAFGKYFEAKGMTDIPPGVALCIVIGSYAVPRLVMGEQFPKTRTRLQKIKGWISAKVVQYKAKKAGVSVKVTPEK